MKLQVPISTENFDNQSLEMVLETPFSKEIDISSNYEQDTSLPFKEIGSEHIKKNIKWNGNQYPKINFERRFYDVF